jgi:hypothetical protein
MTICSYEHYTIHSELGDDGVGRVKVFDPRFPGSPAIYKTTSLDLAIRWIEGYRKGHQWAVEAAILSHAKEER